MSAPDVVYQEPYRIIDAHIQARQSPEQNGQQRKNLFRNISGAQYRPGSVVFRPSSDDHHLNYFEVKIIRKRTTRKFPEVGIGIGPPNYDLTRLPGWDKDGVGYHSDDGHIYHSSEFSQQSLIPSCTVGDVMGCGVVFVDLEGHAMVWFTKNGSVVGRPERAKLPPEGLCTMFGSRHGDEEVLYLGHKQWTPTNLELQAVVPPLKTCPSSKHRFDGGCCRICTVCGLCTGYGAMCANNSSEDRTPGMPCLCSKGDAGCFWCGACRVCADVAIPPGHTLHQHQTYDYMSARERVRKLYRASYKGQLPLTGQGDPQQAGASLAIQQLRSAVSDCENEQQLKLGMVEVQFPYDATLPDELSTKPGDRIEVEGEQEDAKWAHGMLNGKRGLFYKSFTREPSPAPAPPKERSEPEGHKTEFRNKEYVLLAKPDDWLQCTVCHQLADDPHQIPCCGGQTICKKCAEEWKKRNDSCPLCRKSPFETMPDIRVERFINNLQTYCPNYTHGCDWKGGLKVAKEHVTTECEWFVMECECGIRMPRWRMNAHKQNSCIARWVHCPCCGEGGTYCNIVLEHCRSCPNWPVRCPNQCQDGGVSLTRATVEVHCNSVCPEQVVKCKYAGMGCTAKGKRREIPSHMQTDMGDHLDLLMAEYTRVVPALVKENKALKERIQKLEDTGDSASTISSSYVIT